MDLQGKRIVVVGLGRSGVAAAGLCARRGARVVGFDVRPLAALGESVAALRDQGVTLVGAGDLDATLQGAEWIVLSPGVPDLPELSRAAARGAVVIGEVEFSVRALRTPAPIVCVGGTNGKSTTTTLVGALLSASGLNVFVGGNLGAPLADRADDAFDVVVLEVSSFQVERLTTLRPAVALLLNVTPDHLDRYPSFDAYVHAKGNVFTRQDSTDLAVIPVNDALCLDQARRGNAAIVTFGPGGDVDVMSEAVVDHCTGAVFPRDSMRLQGGHNALNAAAAIAVVRPFRVPTEVIADTLTRFEGLPHRTVLVAEIDGVRYYDDSKGTNVGAAVTALRGLRETKAVLLAGGRDKGGSYASLVEALSDKGRAAVVIGEAADAIALAVGDVVPVQRATSMDEAVRCCARLAVPGDAVLLSPGCSSFDMFRDYGDRGDQFVRAVQGLAEENRQ